MESISQVIESPLEISALADAKWRVITDAIHESLEVYAFLLVARENPFRIVDIDLPRQVVSGGSCTVRGKDVVAAGERASRSKLVVVGSIHRHPFGGAFLSSTDDRLLAYMADELASEVTVPVKHTRSPKVVTIRVAESAQVRSESGLSIGPGTYTASGIELEESVRVGRVCCLVWSPSSGYHGGCATVVYDAATGPRYDFRDLSEIEVEVSSDEPAFDRGKLRALAKKLVRHEQCALSCCASEASG